MKIGKWHLVGIFMLFAICSGSISYIVYGLNASQGESTVQIPTSPSGGGTTTLEIGSTDAPNLNFTVLDTKSKAASGSEYTIYLYYDGGANNGALYTSSATSSGVKQFTSMPKNQAFFAVITNNGTPFTSYPVRITKEQYPDLVTGASGPKAITVYLNSSYASKAYKGTDWVTNVYANGSTTANTSTAALALGASEPFTYTVNFTLPAATLDKNQFGDGLNPLECYVNYNAASLSAQDFRMSLNGAEAVADPSAEVGGLSAYASGGSVATSARVQWVGFKLPANSIRQAGGYQVLSLSGKATTTAPIDQNIFVQCADRSLNLNSITGDWIISTRSPTDSTTDVGAADFNVTLYTS